MRCWSLLLIFYFLCLIFNVFEFRLKILGSGQDFVDSVIAATQPSPCKVSTANKFEVLADIHSPPNEDCRKNSFSNIVETLEENGDRTVIRLPKKCKNAKMQM